MDCDHTIDYNVNDGDDGKFGKEMGKSLKGLPQTSKCIRGLKYWMYPKPWMILMLD